MTLPKRSQEVKFRYEDGDWKHVTVLGPAGSRKGKYKNWVNVGYECDKWSMDWPDVEEWQNNQPSDADVNFGFSSNTYDEVFVASKEQGVDEFQQAKLEELDKWKKFDVYISGSCGCWAKPCHRKMGVHKKGH